MAVATAVSLTKQNFCFKSTIAALQIMGDCLARPTGILSALRHFSFFSGKISFRENAKKITQNTTQKKEPAANVFCPAFVPPVCETPRRANGSIYQFANVDRCESMSEFSTASAIINIYGNFRLGIFSRE